MSIKYYVDCGLMVIWISRNRKVFDNIDIQLNFQDYNQRVIRKGALGDFQRLLGHEMHGIYLESDSQIAVTLINEGPPKNSSYRNMIEDCRSMLNKPKSSILLGKEIE